jgi:copper chaperone CopZ
MKPMAIWLALAAGMVFSSAHAATYQLAVDGLACPFCAYGLERQLMKIGGVEDIAVDIGSGITIVTTEDGMTLDRQTAEEAVKTAGFTLKGFEEIPDN